MDVYRKHSQDPAVCQQALANYRWLGGLGESLRVPQLVEVSALSLTFELIQGHHVRPAELVQVAGHLGAVHGTAYARELHMARLDWAFVVPSGGTLRGFPHHRVHAVRRELESGHVAGSLPSADDAAHLIATATGPAAFYKDANPRNFLITATGVVTVDFDDLTLAPFGYDLAKLIVTLAMTHGTLPAAAIHDALASYNAAVVRQPGIPAVTWEQLLGWAEIHHILNSKYIRAGHYRYSWHQVRPSDTVTGASPWR